MVYRPPTLEINQNLEVTQAAEVAPLFATIIGERYELHRFLVTDEQAQIGEYDPTPASTVYLWPDHIAGGLIDLTSASIVVENALLIYNEQLIAVNVTVDNNNEVKSNSNFVWKTNTAAARDSSLGTRDVTIGDTAYLEWDGGSSTLQTLVAGFIAEVVAGTTDPTNVRITGGGDKVEGTTEGVSPVPPTRYTRVYDATAYDGLADGFPSDTYQIQVLTVGTGTASGGSLDNTVLFITSLGNDTPKTITFDATTWNGSAYDLVYGDRGGVGTIDDAGSGTVSVGDTWTVLFSMDYLEVDVANPAEFDTIGPYTGSKDTQYILTVSSGGAIKADDITFNITTNNGADATVTITSLATDWTLDPASIDYPFGNNGMVLRIYLVVSALPSQFNTGDIVTFDVAAPTDGPIETLILRDSVSAVVATDLDITLMAAETVDMDAVFTTLTQDNITIFANATATTNLLGVDQQFKIFFGIMFADYRELDTVIANKLQFISSITDLTDTLGAPTQQNPLSLGVSYALQNSLGTAVAYIATAGATLSDFEDALDVLTEDRVVYGLVPLTNDEDIKNLVATHVNESSTAANNQWRLGWFENPILPILGRYIAQTDGSDILVTIADIGPSLNEFRAFTITNGNLISNGVVPGDTLRINFSTDIDGNITFDEFIIDSITDEQNGKLLVGPPAAITVPIKAEFWTSLTNSEYALALAAYPVQYNNRRIRSIWADGFVNEIGESVELFYLGAAAAGERSGVAPHQPLSRSVLLGVELDPVINFSKANNEVVQGGGNWVIKKDPSTLAVTTAHQLTTITDTDDLIQREDSITTNVDFIARDLYNNLDDLYGSGNVSERMIQLIRQRIHVRSEFIRSIPYSDKIGPQIIEYEIVSILVHPTLKDTIIVEVDYTVPAPLNVLRVNMNIGVG